MYLRIDVKIPERISSEERELTGVCVQLVQNISYGYKLILNRRCYGKNQF
jgi:hypothetical protein